MAQCSKIEWTEITWNPVTGCTKASPGCKNCYAERIAYRFAGMHGFPERPHHFDVVLHQERLCQPLGWRKPRIVFVNSMSDLFHDDVPIEFIQQVFDVMRRTSKHTFQVLTKRSRRLRELDTEIDWPPNVWMGVSVESQGYIFRIGDLAQTRAHIRFLSLEPLIGPLPRLCLQGIDWVIVGGESGPRARPMDKEWVVNIRDQCQAAAVPFFFKQWGGVNKRLNGRTLENQTWDEMPAVQRLPLSVICS